MNAPAIPPQRNQQIDPLKTAGAGVVWRAGWVLVLRQFLLAFWPFALTLKVFLAIALLGLFPLLGPLGHTLLVAAFALGLVASFVVSLRRYQGLGEGAARRAVERESGLAHRPLTTLADTPVVASSLWAQHRQHAAEVVAGAVLRAPRLSLKSLDHPLLRFGSWVVLLVALLVAWDEAPRRLEEAAEPPVERLLPASKLDVWLTPPAYTGQPPLALRADQPDVAVPEGSVLNVRVSGGWFPPVVEMPTSRLRLLADSSGAYQYAAPLVAGGWVKVRQDGRSMGKWRVALLQDAAPTTEFTKPPSPTDQKALRVDFTAADDVGLAKLEAVIEPTRIAASSPHAQPLVLALPLASPPPQHAEGFRYFDLTANPLAGTEVLVSLRATDGKGQVGESNPVTITLPERVFNSPISQALIKLRKELLVRGLVVRRPGAEMVSGLAEELEEQSAETGRHDWTGELALRAIAARLRLSDKPEAIPGLERLMWDTALHFEDGGAGQALNNLRQAQQALEDALKNGASDAEVQQLMRQLEQAMNDYLNELQRQGGAMQQQAGSGEMQMLDRQDLQNMLEQMRQLAGSGARDQALQMLQQMQQLMENLRTPGMAGGAGDPQLQQDMQRLGDISRRQQQMMQSQPENGQTPSGQQSAQQQEGLRHELGDTMQGLAERGYDVNELGKGERAMNSAREGLEQGDQQGAAGQQGQALSHLQQGMRSIQQQAQQRAREGQGGRDPFGRRPNGDGGQDTSRIEIPDRDAAQRARQVLEELRRRSGDYSRPADERDYLDRLLKWF